MKKTALTIIAGFMALCSYAQTAYDALLFSENEYEGTARTMAMGNAFTALGGDLGSIGLNPAGSAVAGYSQLTLTPGFTITSNTAQGISPYTDGSLPYFEKKMKSSMTNFNVPNVGITLNIETGRRTGLKNFTIGFVANKTASYDEDVFAKGMNETTSFMASMAYWATVDGFSGTALGRESAYNDFPWKQVIGYQSGMISTFNSDYEFLGATEVAYEDGDIELGGAIDQSFGKRVTGGKYDYALNAAANISDFLYIGATLGITTFDYSYSEYFKESAIDPYNFEISYTDGATTYFNEMRYSYKYDAIGNGYYGKIGVILTPGGGLRIGAAIQTPTINEISEGWEESGETSYEDREFDAAAESPRGEGGYRMISPGRANFGLAYTFGRFGVISADYEVCNYGKMKYSVEGYDRDHFENENEIIRESFKSSHALRIGAEFKPVAEFAVRAGYGLTTNPETYQDAPKLKSRNLSFGIGYNSKNSFFADLAVRRTVLANESIMPYDDYIFAADENGDILLDKNGNFVIKDGGFAPLILNERSLWKVALTLGWRF